VESGSGMGHAWSAKKLRDIIKTNLLIIHRLQREQKHQNPKTKRPKTKRPFQEKEWTKVCFAQRKAKYAITVSSIFLYSTSVLQPDTLKTSL
jgi:hypothetical protein